MDTKKNTKEISCHNVDTDLMWIRIIFRNLVAYITTIYTSNVRNRYKGLHQTRRDRLKSAPYLRLKNIQRTTIGNIWKNSFQKKFEIFFEKKYFFRKSHKAEKLKKRPFRFIKRFYKPKTSKNVRGYLLIESESFRKKSHSAEKKREKNQTKENLWSRIYFWKHKSFVV